MTAGERSDRGYGHDDEYAPSPYPAYPAPSTQVPSTWAEPTYRPEGAGWYDGAGRPYNGNGYPNGSSGYPAAGGYPVAGGDGYRTAGANGRTAGANGHAGGRHSADNGRHHQPGYSDPRYDASGYGRQDPTYGQPDPAYRHQDPRYRYQAPGYNGYTSPDQPYGGGSYGYAQAYPQAPPAQPATGRSYPASHDVAGHRQLGGSGGQRPPVGAGGGRGKPPAGADASEDVPERQGRSRRLPLWQELPLLLVIAFCLAVLIRTFLLQAFFIPSGSMEDTLIAGDRVLVNKVIYNFRDPTRGEVVVFKGTDAWAPLSTDDDIGTFAKVGRTFGDLVGVSRPGEKDFIKRVVGLPGDVVSCCDEQGRVLVNGEPIDEPYVIRDSPLAESVPEVSDCRSRQFREVVVEPGNLFVMGDHRARSQDSRCQGQVPIENVIGRAFIIVWPNDRWAGLSATDAFASVPGPAVAAGVPDQLEQGPAPVSAQLGIVLPVLLPLLSTSALGARGRAGGTPAVGSGRARAFRRGAARRLSA